MDEKGYLQLIPKDGVRPRAKEGQKKKGQAMNDKTVSLVSGDF